MSATAVSPLDAGLSVGERVSTGIECQRAGLDATFVTEEFQTTGHWQRGWWQTAIPYRVEFRVSVADRTALDAVEPTTPGVAAPE